MSAGGHGLQAAVIRLAVRYRGIVVVLACLLLARGIFAIEHAKYDVFPEFAPAQVAVQTEAAGLAPEQVEVLVTQPLENALGGVPGLKRLQSASVQGFSSITATFGSGGDIYRDRQMVAERVAAAAAQLPKGADAPTLAPLTSSTSTVLVVGLTSASHSPMELRTVAEWTLRPKLLAVPGVAKIALFGGGTQSFQIQVHPDRLVRFGIGLDDVLAAARRATGVRGAGVIDTPNQRIVLQTKGQILDAGELGRAVLVSHGGTPVPLAAVADVVEAPEPAIGGASIMGKPGIQVVVSGQYGANTVEVTRRVEAALAELKPALASDGITLHDGLFRPANFIDTATHNVAKSLLLGGVLVAATVLLFLFELRTAAISCAAIPLSLVAAVTVLEAMGATLNTMMLGGLAIAIGVVVDDAVIDVENIIRRLRENTHSPAPRPVARVVVDACIEVRGAVLYATLAVVLVALPLLAMSGLAGRLFGSLGMAYVLAVLASLAVAFTVTPALAMLLLAGQHLHEQEPPLMRWSKARYRDLLRDIAARHRGAAIAGAVGLTLAACAVLPLFGASFIPELSEGHVIVHMSAVPGTSIAESMRLGDRVSAALMTLPAVRSVSQRAGRAEMADDVNGTHYSEFEVDLKPMEGDAAEAVQGDIRGILARFPGVNFAVNTFLSERMDETLSGAAAAVVVNVYGDDLDRLDAEAGQIARVLRSVKGAADVQVQSPPGMPQVTIRLRQQDLRRWGLDAVDVLDAVRTAYGGDTVGQVYDGSRIFPVVVLLDPASRGDVAAIGDLPLKSPGGIYVHLRQVADILEEAGRYQILHSGARRVQAVTANVAGVDVASFVRAAKAKIAAEVPLPKGSYLEFGGQAEGQAQSRRDLLVNGLMAAFGIVLLLSVVTRSANNLLLVLANLPFAFVGGVLAVFASGGLLSLGSMVGFVALFGITLRNSILMVAHYDHLVREEAAAWGLETVLRGAADRLTPILMTSLVTALGVLPLAINAGAPGQEIEGPMAVVILGGLLTSIALNLLVLPVLALRYGRFCARDPSELA